MYFGRFSYSEGTDIFFTKFEGKNVDEYNLVVRPGRLGDIESQARLVEQAWSLFSAEHSFRGAKVVFQRIFCSDVANQKDSVGLLSFSPNVSILQQSPLCGNKIETWLVVWKSKTEGQIEENEGLFLHNGYSHWFQTQLTQIESKGAYNQTLEIFDSYIKKLQGKGQALSGNCMRTWLFVHDIDNNYQGMVRARNHVFEAENLMPETHFIASTGIEGCSCQPNEYVMMDAYSVDGLSAGQVSYLKATSHLNPTYEYGVSFERGTAIDYGDRRHVFISGTASIDNQGKIVYPGNIEKQTERVFENVKALLSNAEAEMADVNFMCVYLRDIADKDFAQNYLNEHYGDIPAILVYAPVCRKGWLIEIECTATKNVDKPLFRDF